MQMTQLRIHSEKKSLSRVFAMLEFTPHSGLVQHVDCVGLLKVLTPAHRFPILMAFVTDLSRRFSNEGGLMKRRTLKLKL